MKATATEIHSHFPLFDKELVEEIVAEAETKTYDRGESLVKEGQYIRSTYLIMDGLVKVIRENGNGNEFFMHYLKAGDACALSMIFTTRSHGSYLTLKAVEKTMVLCVPFPCMEKWMLQYKSWNKFVWQNFRQRIEGLFETLDNIVFHNMEERLLFYLELQAKQLKRKQIPTTQTEIAREMNSSREVIGRILKKLSYKGSLKINRHSIELTS